MNPSKRRGLLAGLILFGLSASVIPVYAHSDLKESRPVEGQTVRQAIDSVDLVFWSAFSDPSVEVIGPAGISIPGVTTQVDDLTVRFNSAALAQVGEYLVRYQILSSDGDLSSGEFAFAYDPDSSSGSGLSWIVLVAAAVGLIGILWLRRTQARG